MTLCACNLGADAVVQTATPAGLSAALTVIAPTTTPPDPIPGAATALLNGDYDTARTLYTTTATTANPTLKCAALYGLGVTDLRAAQPAVDVAGLTAAESALTLRAYRMPADVSHVCPAWGGAALTRQKAGRDQRLSGGVSTVAGFD